MHARVAAVDGQVEEGVAAGSGGVETRQSTPKMRSRSGLGIRGPRPAITAPDRQDRRRSVPMISCLWAVVVAVPSWLAHARTVPSAPAARPESRPGT